MIVKVLREINELQMEQYRCKMDETGNLLFLYIRMINIRLRAKIGTGITANSNQGGQAGEKGLTIQNRFDVHCEISKEKEIQLYPTFSIRMVPQSPRRPAVLSDDLRAQSSPTTTMSHLYPSCLALSTAKPKFILSPVQFFMMTTVPPNTRLVNFKLRQHIIHVPSRPTIQLSARLLTCTL